MKFFQAILGAVADDFLELGPRSLFFCNLSIGRRRETISRASRGIRFISPHLLELSLSLEVELSQRRRKADQVMRDMVSEREREREEAMETWRENEERRRGAHDVLLQRSVGRCQYVSSMATVVCGVCSSL